MAETLKFTENAGRKTIYVEIAPQIASLIGGEDDLVANLANVAAVLKEALGFFWVGFYLVKDGQLVLGPFQGPLACTRISLGNGVCGQAWETRETLIVPDVNKFPGHIVCNSAARSEIVLPIFKKDGSVAGVLDADSEVLSYFSQTDADGLSSIVKIVETIL